MPGKAVGWSAAKNKRVRHEVWKQRCKIYPLPAESYILEMNKTSTDSIGSKPEEFMNSWITDKP
jgi:hypothetical protein